MVLGGLFVEVARWCADVRRRRAYLSVLAAMLLLPLVQSGAAEPSPEISDPEHIPYMNDFSTPPEGIVPGSRGVVNFTLTNRYDAPMENVTLVTEIFRFATLDGSQPIASLPSAPSIREGAGQRATFPFSIIAPMATLPIRLTLQTRSENIEGTYFIRSQLDFWLDGQSHRMRSVGHFTKEQWQAALDTANESDPGGVNLTLLQVDGILVDISFSIRTSVPQWPFYLLLGAAVLTGVLALMFYLVDEHRGSPRMTAVVLRLSGKAKVETSTRRRRRKRRERKRELPKRQDDGPTQP